MNVKGFSWVIVAFHELDSDRTKGRGDDHQIRAFTIITFKLTVRFNYIPPFLSANAIERENQGYTASSVQ